MSPTCSIGTLLAEVERHADARLFRALGWLTLDESIKPARVRRIRERRRAWLRMVLCRIERGESAEDVQLKIDGL